MLVRVSDLRAVARGRVHYRRRERGYAHVGALRATDLSPSRASLQLLDNWESVLLVCIAPVCSVVAMFVFLLKFHFSGRLNSFVRLARFGVYSKRLVHVCLVALPPTDTKPGHDPAVTTRAHLR